MYQIQSLIINKLKTDTNLVPSPFVDVVNRMPVEGGPFVPGSTPQFWNDATGKMGNAIWVEDHGEEDAPFAEGLGGRRANAKVACLVHATDAGKAAASLLEQRIIFHFGKRYYAMQDGTNWQFRYYNRWPTLEGSEWGFNGMLYLIFDIEVVGIAPGLIL